MFFRQIYSGKVARNFFLVFVLITGFSGSNSGYSRVHDPDFDSIHKTVFSNPSKAEQYIIEYASKAVHGRDNLVIGKAALLMAELNYLRSNLYRSAFYYQKALSVFKILKRDDFAASAYVGIGSVFLVMDDFERAEMYQRKALAYHVKRGDKLSQADVLYNIGNIKMNQVYPDTALMYYSFAESIYLQESDFESLSRLYLVNGFVNHMMGNDSLAIKQERMAHKLALTYSDSVAVYGALFSIASIFENSGQLDSSKFYYNIALDVSERIKNPDMEADALAHLSAIYEAQDSVEISHAYLQKSLRLKDSVNDLSEMNRIHKMDFDQYELPSDTEDDFIINSRAPFFLGLILFVAAAGWISFIVRKKRGLKRVERQSFEQKSHTASVIEPDTNHDVSEPFILQMNENLVKEINAALAKSEQTENPLKSKPVGQVAFVEPDKSETESFTQKVSDTARLEAELVQTKKELITRNIQISQQKEIIDTAAKELRYLSVTSGAKEEKELHKILSTLKSAKSSANWDEFEMYFNEIHAGFYKKLNEEFPNLTVNERRLCGLICLNLNNKEISQVTNKSSRSIEVARYRMRKKMKLERDTALISKLSSFL